MKLAAACRPHYIRQPMRGSALTLLLLVLGAVAGTPAAAQNPLSGAATAMRALITSSGAEAAVLVRDLATGDTLFINPDLEFHAASTMKVPVMVQVFREIDAGRLSLRDRLPVADSFRSIADSSWFRLSAADDSDSSLYRRVGETATVQELVELMITRSSNLATNILIDRVRATAVQQTMEQLGAAGMLVRRGVEDGAAFRAGLNNTTTARALGTVLAALADGRAATPWSCGEMLDIMTRQRFRSGIPAGLPRRTRVAHKTGQITALHHDAGVVYVRRRPRYVIVVLTRGIQDNDASARLISGLAALAHATLGGSPDR